MWSRSLRTLLPRAWNLRLSLRGIDRHYRPRVAAVKDDEREALRQEHMEARQFVIECLREYRTSKLIRQASRYDIFPPSKPYSNEDKEDTTWEYGWVSDTWLLKDEAVAAIKRQIDEAKLRRLELHRRRLELLELGAKLVGNVIPWLVSFLLALALYRRK